MTTSLIMTQNGMKTSAKTHRFGTLRVALAVVLAGSLLSLCQAWQSGFPKCFLPCRQEALQRVFFFFLLENAAVLT